jgi:hypothetical protein
LPVQVRLKWMYKNIEPVCYIGGRDSSESRPAKPVEAKELHLKYFEKPIEGLQNELNKPALEFDGLLRNVGGNSFLLLKEIK